ncbi:MAG: hypothetical protein ACHREM_04325 [Polyangiales bacterium]
MALVLFTAAFDRPNPRPLPGDPRAVPAAPYAHVDDEAGNPGGITRADVADEFIRALSGFEDGAEIFVESDDDGDVLDDEEAEGTRIWWRAVVVER